MQQFTEQRTVYKMDSTNQIREWTVWVENTRTIIRHGLLNGTKIFECQTHTFHEDAVTDATRRYLKQVQRRGYTTTIPQSRPFLPMLAQTYQDHRAKVPNSIIVQPKLDGYRCLGSYKQMRTRTNVLLPSFPQINKALANLPPEIVLDGELYNHGSRFQRIMKSRAHLPSEDSLFIEYHVYDLVDEKLPYTTRRTLLSETILDLQDAYEKNPFIYNSQPIPFPILPVSTHFIKSSEIDTYLAKFESEGYEGLMVRNPEYPYELDTRSYGLLKYKRVEKDLFKIVDIKPGPKTPKLGVFVCELPNKTTFDCTPKGTVDFKKSLLLYPTTFIGKWLEVEYVGTTDLGKPKCAVGARII